MITVCSEDVIILSGDQFLGVLQRNAPFTLLTCIEIKLIMINDSDQHWIHPFILTKKGQV